MVAPVVQDLEHVVLWLLFSLTILPKAVALVLHLFSKFSTLSCPVTISIWLPWIVLVVSIPGECKHFSAMEIGTSDYSPPWILLDVTDHFSHIFHHSIFIFCGLWKLAWESQGWWIYVGVCTWLYSELLKLRICCTLEHLGFHFLYHSCYMMSWCANCLTGQELRCSQLWPSQETFPMTLSTHDWNACLVWT